MRERMTKESFYSGHMESSTFAELLKTCVVKKDLYTAIRLHNDIFKRGLLQKNPYLASILITLYSRCGVPVKSQEVHNDLCIRNVISWSALVAAYACHGQAYEALNCFEQMQTEGFHPDAITLISALKACGCAGAISKGKQIHNEIVSKGFLKKSTALGTALLNMYAKCGSLEKAHRILEELPERNQICWSALIAGYAEQGNLHDAFDFFQRMQDDGFSPDAVTFTCMVKVCGIKKDDLKGQLLHCDIVKMGFLKNDIVLANALVDMYAKCGMIKNAKQMLDELHDPNVVSWSTLISGYAELGQGEEAINCFQRMRNESLSADTVTFICILKACVSTESISKGKQIHQEIMSRGLLKRNVVLGNALVDMYAKCGALSKAQKIHDNLPDRNVVSWSALIAGYVQQKQGHEALYCFERMQSEGLYPNAVTFTSVCKACGITGAIDKGKEIHDEIIHRGLLEKDVMLGNALVDMYAKCGMLTKALDLHGKLPVRTVSSWNVLIAGYAQHGCGHEALNCFDQMQDDGIAPDAVTFLSLLNACSQSGFVEKGEMYLRDMYMQYGIAPSLEHHTWMVAIFAITGHFDKAMCKIMTMPTFDHYPIWHAILGACEKWGNVELGNLAFDQVLQLDNSCAAVYVLMSSIYRSAGMQEDAAKVDVIRMKCMKSQQPESVVWVDISGNNHANFIIEI